MSKVAVILENGFEEIEALTIVDYLRRANIKVETISINSNRNVISAHNIEIKSDLIFDEVNKDFDVIFIPGGLKATEKLRRNEKLKDVLVNMNKNSKIIASICAGPTVLYDAGILKDKIVTSHPSVKDQLKEIKEYSEDRVVICDNIITSRSAGTAGLLAMTLIKILKNKEESKKVIEQILFRD